MSKSGFTIIELMIVVAIISFLAVLGIPHLFHYKAMAYQAEVAMNLASLHTAQQAYFAQHGKYTAVLCGENGLNWKPTGYQGPQSEPQFYYTYGFNIPGAQEGVHFFTGKFKTPKEALGATVINETHFTVGAAADVMGTKKIDTWHINESRAIENVAKGID